MTDLPVSLHACDLPVHMKASDHPDDNFLLENSGPAFLRTHRGRLRGGAPGLAVMGASLALEHSKQASAQASKRADRKARSRPSAQACRQAMSLSGKHASV